MKRARRTQLVLAFLAQFSIVMSSALEARVQVQPSTPKLENDLRRAAERGEVKLVQDLANAGVNVNAPDNRGRTALHLASMKGEAAVIAALLGTANIDATDSDGRTPLMLAADGAHLAVVRLLVARGAQLETKDRRGVTALGLARSRSADVSAEIQSAIEKQRAKEEGERYLALLGQSQ
jgi:ankyrin repeat protein